MSKLDELELSFKVRVQKLIDELKVMGITVVPTSCYRSIEEQDKLYAQGRTAKGAIVTKAKGGQSPHNFKLACDVCPLKPSDGSLWWDAPQEIWNVIHKVAEEGDLLDLDSGYDWKFVDRPHVEDTNWRLTQAAWREGKWHA